MLLTLISAFLSFILLYKYIGLFLISFFSTLLLPLPSSSVLAASGAFAAQGYFNINLVLVVSFLGNVCGDIAGYFLARVYGVTFLKKIGFENILSSHLYKKLTVYMHDFSYSLIFFSRFLTTVDPMVNIISGITKIPYRL